MKVYCSKSAELQRHHSKSSEWHSILPSPGIIASDMFFDLSHALTSITVKRLISSKFINGWFDYLSHTDAEIISV